MKLYIIFIFLLQCSTFESRSALGELVNDLSILARISNAIALHVELFQTKSINASAVAREIIEGQEELLDTVRKVNITAAIWGLDWLSAETTKAKSLTEQLSMADIQEIDELLIFVSRSLIDWERLNESMSITAEDFVNNIRNQTIVDSLLPCKVNVLEPIVVFYKIQNELEIVQDTQLVKRFMDLADKAKTNDLKACLDSLQTYSSSNHKLTKNFKEMRALYNLKRFAKSFQSRKNKLSTDISEQIEKIQKFAEKTRSLWTGLPLPVDPTYIDKTFVLYEQNHDYWMSESPPKALTIAFQDYNQMPRVKNDLKSEFFLKHIVRGQEKELKKFNQSLGEFFKFAKVMDSLEEEWGKSKAYFEKEFDNIENVNTTIDTFLQFNETVDIANTLKQMANDSGECSTILASSTQTAVDQDFSSFELDYDVPMKLMREAKNFLNDVETMKNMSTDRLITFMEHFHNVSTLETIDEENIHQNIQVLRRLDDYWLFESFSKIMYNFYQAESKYLKIAADGANLRKSSFRITTYLVNSQAMKFLKCFKDRNVDFLLIGRIMAFFHGVTTFPGDDETKVTREFFETVRRVQSKYESLLSFMKTPRKVSKIPHFERALEMAQNFGRGVMVLGEMRRILERKDELFKSVNLSEKSKKALFERSTASVKSLWLGSPLEKFQKLVSNLQKLEPVARKALQFSSGASSIDNLKNVFKFAKTITDIPVTKQDILNASIALIDVDDYEQGVFENLTDFTLNFASFHGDLNAAAASLDTLKKDFDGLFGLLPAGGDSKQVRTEKIFMNNLDTGSVVLIVISFSLATLFVFIITVLVGYGFTKTGRMKYIDFYLYYFPNEKILERRRRYSFFMDRNENINHVTECSREINTTTLKKVLLKGAYINPYSNWGETALHEAARMGHPEIVRLLIINGADRTLLNWQNKTAEQIIPNISDVKDPEKKEKVEKTIYYFEKYRNKTFRTRVPRVFPAHLFHIFTDHRTEPKLTTKFIYKFEAFCSAEPLQNTTHYVAKCNKEGILESDDVEVLSWIFHGVIVVNDKWLSACIEDPKMIEKDELFLVEHVKYKGVLYKDCVLPWSRAWSEGAFPYLFGVQMVFVMKDLPYYGTLTLLLAKLGAVYWEQFPTKEMFNKGTHPYLHANMGPLWVVHDGSFDLKAYENDPDGMWQLMRMEDLMIILLKRAVFRDKNPNPIPVTQNNDD